MEISNRPVRITRRINAISHSKTNHGNVFSSFTNGQQKLCSHVENHVLKTTGNGCNRGLLSFRHLEML